MVSGRIGKIVGLDPAGPLFSFRNADSRLASTDAEYVETIHTNAGLLGIPDPIGDASFYPNGGSRQPGCGFDPFGICAHSRSIAYYLESIYNVEKYWAVKCESWRDMRRGRCHVNDESELTEMGGENPNGNS